MSPGFAPLLANDKSPMKVADSLGESSIPLFVALQTLLNGEKRISVDECREGIRELAV
jgi:hypothetical protein